MRFFLNIFLLVQLSCNYGIQGSEQCPDDGKRSRADFNARLIGSTLFVHVDYGDSHGRESYARFPPSSIDVSGQVIILTHVIPFHDGSITITHERQHQHNRNQLNIDQRRATQAGCCAIM